MLHIDDVFVPEVLDRVWVALLLVKLALPLLVDVNIITMVICRCHSDNVNIVVSLTFVAQGSTMVKVLAKLSTCHVVEHVHPHGCRLLLHDRSWSASMWQAIVIAAEFTNAHQTTTVRESLHRLNVKI